jgi:hypothetical protein
VFVFLGLLFLVLLVLLAPGIFLGSFALINTSSVGRQRFGMGGGWHGVEKVVGGKNERDASKDDNDR